MRAASLRAEDVFSMFRRAGIAGIAPRGAAMKKKGTADEQAA